MTHHNLGKLTLILLAALFAFENPLHSQNVVFPRGLAAPPKLERLPAFALPNIGGGTIRSADLIGKVAVIRFWATH